VATILKIEKKQDKQWQTGFGIEKKNKQWLNILGI
jgi:hypothetical protein